MHWASYGAGNIQNGAMATCFVQFVMFFACFWPSHTCELCTVDTVDVSFWHIGQCLCVEHTQCLCGTHTMSLWHSHSVSVAQPQCLSVEHTQSRCAGGRRAGGGRRAEGGSRTTPCLLVSTPFPLTPHTPTHTHPKLLSRAAGGLHWLLFPYNSQPTTCTQQLTRPIIHTG